MKFTLFFTALCTLIFATACADSHNNGSEIKPYEASVPETNPYMGAPVILGKAPNGAITNKKLLDRMDDIAWLSPTIDGRRTHCLRYWRHKA